jgi:hypothetical protein
MLRKFLFLALAAALVTLLTTSQAQAWGAFHAGYTHVGYGGVQHYGYTSRSGPYGSYSGAHYGSTSAYGGYHSGYGYGESSYGGYHYGSSSYSGYHYGGFGGTSYGGYSSGVYRGY